MFLIYVGLRALIISCFEYFLITVKLNGCAVYIEKEYHCRGIAGHLLNMVVDDLKSKDIALIYLLTDHIGFYERYGWEFLCMVQGDDAPDMSRMYIHR